MCQLATLWAGSNITDQQLWRLQLYSEVLRETQIKRPDAFYKVLYRYLELNLLSSVAYHLSLLLSADFMLSGKDVIQTTANYKNQFS